MWYAITAISWAAKNNSPLGIDLVAYDKFQLYELGTSHEHESLLVIGFIKILS